MDRHTIRKRAVKKVGSFYASFDNENPSGSVPEKNTATECNEIEFDWDSDSQQGSESQEDSESHGGVMGSNIPLCEALCDWAVKFKISLVALSALLSILRCHHPSLPLDARTLLKTATIYNIKELAGGTYYYFGILKAFGKSLERMASCFPDNHVFSLQINIDGLPLFRSSSMQFWPILGLLNGVTRKPGVIALFCGNSKPNCLTTYLEDIVTELQQLSRGFAMCGKQWIIKLGSVICDAPARAFIKGTKSHTGYSGCDKCEQKGVYVKHRMTFPEVNCRRRSDVAFEEMRDENHHVTSSPLRLIGIGMVSGFPHDYMHLVCLGVMRRLLNLWFSGPFSCRMSFNQMERISQDLIDLRPFIPVDFARKPRSLAERLRWKATELRQFLLYTGPVCLQRQLHPAIYGNFMLLSVAIFILASPSFCSKLNDLASHLLVCFVQHFQELYGPEFVTYNIHGLVHLPEDVAIHGNLDVISGFPFENYLGQIKKLVRSPYRPLAQVVRRISEIDGCLIEKEALQKSQLLREHTRGPIPKSHMEPNLAQFEELIISGTTIKTTSEGDKCVRIGDRIALVQNIFLSLGKVYIVFKEFEVMQPFYQYPLNSEMLGIHLVSKLSSQLKVSELQGHVQKYVRLPSNENFVAIPLLHFL